MKGNILTIIKTTFILIMVLGILFSISYSDVLAQDYVSLSPLPGTETVDTSDPSTYFQTIFILFVSIISILAVIRLMLCGFQYMTSEAISSKENAKNCIWTVIFGIFIILLSVLVLQTINPQLIEINFDTLKTEIDKASISTPSSLTPSTTFPYPPVGNVVDCKKPSISIANACETLDSERENCLSKGCKWYSHPLPNISVCGCGS